MTNKTTEALKLAKEALGAAIDCTKLIAVYAAKTGNDDLAMEFLNESKFDKALAAIREALADHIPDTTKMIAEPVKQEPVAYMVKAHDSVQRFAVRADVADEFACKWRETDPDADFYPLYAAPVDAKAIRAEALEEAAVLCESKQWNDEFECAAAIRGLK